VRIAVLDTLVGLPEHRLPESARELLPVGTIAPLAANCAVSHMRKCMFDPESFGVTGFRGTMNEQLGSQQVKTLGN
jgi:hypothetical protein